MVFLILKTFDPLPKKNGRILALDRKLKITQNDINKTFQLIKTCEIIRSNENIKKFNYENFQSSDKKCIQSNAKFNRKF